MEDYKLEKFKEILLEEKGRIRNALENRSEKKDEMNQHPENELSTVDNHPADIGTELFMKEQDEGFKTSYKDTLDEIENSLSNIQDGTYGLCSSCGDQIDEERLEAIPYASLCMNCMKDDVHTVEDKYESLDEDYITRPNHNRNNVGFDREDAYQDIIEYDRIPKDPSNLTGDYMGIVDGENNNTEEIDNISQEYYDKTKE